MTDAAANAPPLQIETLPLDALTPYARNARTHSPAQVAQIVASVREFGWTNPVLIDEAGGLIAGHGRVLAAREMGLQAVPCIRLVGLSEAQKRAYVLADNKLALNAGWDEVMLEAELEALQDLDFDIGITGFEDVFDDPSTPSASSDPTRTATDMVADRFWISIRGPLTQQAHALQRLLTAMKDLPGVEVALGTVSDG